MSDKHLIAEAEEECPNCRSGTIGLENGRLVCRGECGHDFGRECPDSPDWIESHSVNCYFCGKLVDERDCTPADDLNDSNGGECCPECRKARTTEQED